VSFRRVIVGVRAPGENGDASSLAERLAAPETRELVAVHVERHHGRPSPAHELFARAAGADLIVLGAGKAAAPGHTAPSRTALRVLEHAPCPVAIAPRQYREAGPFHHVGVAYDGSAEGKAALAAAYDIAARDRAAMTLYWTITDGRVAYAGVAAPDLDSLAQAVRVKAQDALDLAADAAPAGVNPETVLLRGDAAREIGEAAAGVVDLLFTGTRGRGTLQRAIAGSVSQQLLLTATQPVVVVPQTAGD
jgi:nucleotide-binding universal stress UspA family protein